MSKMLELSSMGHSQQEIYRILKIMNNDLQTALGHNSQSSIHSISKTNRTTSTSE
jgi:hypothetical protein